MDHFPKAVPFSAHSLDHQEPFHLLSLNQLSKRFGAQILFEDVSASFYPGHRYGIVGANGAGKSTFFKILTGETDCDQGDISFHGSVSVGTLNQDHFAFESWTISEVVLAGKERLFSALQEKDRLLHDPHGDPMRIAELEELIASEDGYLADSQIAEILIGLGIEPPFHHQTMSVLSGGYKLRVLLAQILFKQPDILLLDEPTNHLDIYSIQWLENYLIQCGKLVLVISHDRTFLNRVSTDIVDLDYQTLKIYPGNYDAFLKQREEEDLYRTKEAEKAQKKIDELSQFVTRFKAKATKARQAQSKARQIEKMESALTEPVYSSRSYPHFSFPLARNSGKDVLVVDQLSKAFGDKKVLNQVGFHIQRGEKWAIIGPNGIGKSTLLKILMGELTADAGSFTWGFEAQTAYFAQDHQHLLDPKSTPFEWLYQFGPGETVGRIRTILGQHLFSGDDVNKPIAALSGGECARLILAKLHLARGNVLVLDEPTNHLDMEAIESLKESLATYAGTLVLVSHSRYLIEGLTTHILAIDHHQVELFPGTYSEFVAKRGVDHLLVDPALNRKKAKKSPTTPVDPHERQKLKDLKKRYRQLLQERQEVEGLIDTLERAIESLQQQMSTSDYFQTTPAPQIREHHQALSTQQESLEHRMESWSALSEQIEQLEVRHGFTPPPV